MFRKGRGSSNAAASGPSGRQMRKERRKEERATSKKRSAPLVPNFEGHDSQSRSAKRRVELFAAALQKSIEKEEQRLKNYTLPKTPEQLEAERLKKRGSGLKGAARPAWEVYPELYPEMHKEEPPEPTFDLIKKHSPNCYHNEETRSLVSLNFQLGYTLLAEEDLKGKGRQAQHAFKRSLELDTSDPFNARLGYLVASMDRGEIVDEFATILRTDSNDNDIRNAEILYHRALMEFMSETELQEKKAKQKAKAKFRETLALALKACPEIAAAIIHHEIVSAIVDHAQVLGWFREEREQRCKSAEKEGQPDRIVSRCDAGICHSARGMAIAFFVNFAQYWVNLPIMEVISEMLEDVDYDAYSVDDEDKEDEEEDEPGKESMSSVEFSEAEARDRRAIDKTLKRFFEEAALKFGLVAT